MDKKRTIIIGLDGVPYRLLEDLAQNGVMPNVSQIIQGGIFRKMASSIPEISSVAWSSVITGKNPGEHGIFGFIDLFPNSYRMRFPNFNDLKTEPFWMNTDGKSVIINVPSTYPVKDMNGVHISGFVSIDFDRSVHPKSLVSKLRELDYRLDVDSSTAHKSMQLFLSDLDNTLEARIRAYRHLWEEIDWHTFMLVFTGTDRLMHFLWNAYEDKNHRYHQDFLEHFRKIDQAIGEIGHNMNDEDSLIMLSDHGFERLEEDVYINYLLRKEGILDFTDNSNPDFSKISAKTKAFALDPARIYVNLKGKYPCGGVEKNDKEKVIEELISLFSALKIDGKKVIRDIYRKEDIYSGPFLDAAPDLILVGNRGFNLKAKINADRLLDKDIFTGKHTQDDAFLLLYSDKLLANIPDKPTVSDIRWVFQSNKTIVS